MAAGPDKILAISGGVGGAKLALGLSRILAPEQLLICANTADDFTHLGLRICPDLDTVMYTLAGLNNTRLGWGLAGESWQFMESLGALGGADWFRLGDKDLATHVMRTHMLSQGRSLTELTRQLCRELGVEHGLLPMSNEPVATVVETDEGDLPFQDYFVRRQCEPAVRGYRFEGLEEAEPQAELMALLRDPDLEAIIICPSNPFVSVAPVLALQGLREALLACPAPVIAVSPIVGGRALKGPAAKMMREMQLPATALEVGRYYAGLLDGFVIDECDRDQASLIEGLGMKCLVTGTVMHTLEDKTRLARELLTFVRI